MWYKRSSLRYAHTSGHTELIYTQDGEFIITCGSDGDVRKWHSIDDDDPTSNCLGEFVLCVAHNGDKMLASTDRNTVQIYALPNMDNEGPLMRFTAPVTCLRVTKLYIGAGSEDTNIKVHKQGESQSEIQLQGHTGPVLALDISCKGLLASAGGDGLLKIWYLESATEVKTIAGLTKTNSFESAVCFCTPVFEPLHGNTLAYVKGREIYVLSTFTWDVQFTLYDEDVSGDYTCCQFSYDGQFLAAGTTNGEFSLFDFVRKQPLKCEAPPSDCQSISCLAWNPKNNREFAFCDVTGQLGTLFAEKVAMVNGGEAFADNEAAEVDFGELEFEKDNMSSEKAAGYVDDDEDDPNCISIEKLKMRVMKASGARVNDDVPDDDETKDSATSFRQTFSAADAECMIKLYKKQASFQPGSTPTHLEHRYLVWNDVGTVTAHTDNAEGSIDVEFHDASTHHSLHILNYNNHNMASLSTSVLALSAESSTKLVCIALAASGNKEWSVQMPDCESVEALAATSKLVAVATSMQFLRLFTIMGTQREVISIPGAVLAIAGHKHQLFVCYHSASPTETQQHLSALLIRTQGLSLRSQQIPVPLPPNRQMTWIGFSDCGSPAFGDHMGLIQLYSSKSNCWYPVCDTMKLSQSVSNNYFVISISESQQIIQAVLCRGTSYPMTNPRPMMQELPMHIPNGDIDTEKSDLEDALMRANFMTINNADKTIKETAIKLFALACRSETEMRAKELIETIACPQLLQLAVKYATKLGRIHLSDRLSELMPMLEEQQQSQSVQQELRAMVLMQNTLPFPLIPSVQNSTDSCSFRLAPKTMELAGKRGSLKRFSATANTPSTNKKSFVCTEQLIPSTQNSLISESPSIETQENTCDKTTQEDTPTARLPLNLVNPFASKRKLSDVDFSPKSLLNGTGKLKFPKK